MKHLPIILILIAAATAGCLFGIFPKWTVDDAYISYRYGVNLATTGELVWNPGEKPVEGYTGIVLPLLAALFYKSGIDIPLAMQSLGVMAWIGTFLLIWKILKSHSVNPWVTAASLLLFSFLPIFYTHALSGLETMLFTCALTVLTFCNSLILKRKELHTSSMIGLASSGLFLSLIRPEGLAVTGFLMGLSFLFRILNLKKFELKFIIICLIVWVLPMSGYLFWKNGYYGNFLPNTWYAKKYQGSINLDPVLELGHTVLVTIGPLLLFIILMTLFIRTPKPRNYSEKGRTVFILSLFCIPFVFVLGYLRSELFMNYSHRFFAPVIPVLLVALALKGDELRAEILEYKEANKFKIKWITILMVFFSSIQVIFFIMKTRTELYFTNYYKHVVEEELKPAAAVLKEVLPLGAKVAIYMDAGVIPYYSGFKCIDFGKLNDPYLAHGPRDARFVADYFFDQAPEAAVFNSFSEERYEYIAEAHAIQADPRFEKYRLFRKFNTSIGYPYYQFLYLRTNH